MNIDHILCVCTGNICRSPLAEGLFRKALDGVETSSAGIGAVVGGGMPPEADLIARREGLKLEDHRGRQLTESIVRGSDIVLVMEVGQLRWVTAQFPESRGRVFMLTHWVGGADVDDPFRLDEGVFERVYREMEEAVAAWTAKLRRN